MSEPKPRLWWNAWGIAWDLSATSSGRVQLGLYTGIGIILFAAGGLLDRLFLSPLQITPEHQRFGWNEQAAKTEAPRIAALMPKFAITNSEGDSVSGAGKFAELWKFGKLSNGGKHLGTWKQESGDCVSMGWSNAIAYRQAFQIANEQRNEVLKIPFPPYIYGVSRVLIGKRQLGRGAGSVGAWAAQGSLSYGVLPIDHATELGFSYSGRLADQWGWLGPPKDATEFGSKFRIRTVSQVKSWEDVRDALVHGYPCTVASNVGFEGQFVDVDGKRWGTASGRWGHQMCFIGAEDRPHRNRGAYVINSWGADAHPKPLNDEPPGGFWVKWQDVQRMVQQGDSWAYSDFDGFPAEAVADWNMFRARATERDEQAELAAIDQIDPPPVLLEIRQMFAPSVLLLTLIVGLVVFATCLRLKFNQRTQGILSLLLACSLLGLGTSADAGPRARRYRFQEPVNNCPNGICTPGNVCPAGTCRPGMTCANGVCRPTDPASGGCQPTGSAAASTSLNLDRLTNGLRPAAHDSQIQLASTEEVPVAVWNAFAARAVVQDTPVQAWNAMDPVHRKLRTYKDCFDSEKDFLLIIGSHTAAEKQLIVSRKPVAFESSLKGLDSGEYRVFEMPGLRLRIERLYPQRHLANTVTKPRGQ
ncbi:MAG: hypothetical protein JWM11_6510 [Planctomycetaceae bacterium]|nr:hypothetical protein [Planctomycetaceae bacterium]